MEVLVRNPELPSRAGKARIEFGFGEARRSNDIIVLPAVKGASFTPLLKGEQFVYSAEGKHYFGGTDEEPFLVRLNAPPISSLNASGEEAFYQSIIPEPIQRVQKVLGVKHKRQGDIFAVPVPFSWDTLRAFEAMRKGVSISDVSPEHEEFNVFETRHSFSGIVMGAMLDVHGRDMGLHNFTHFAEGRLQAPDHEDLSFRQPHFLAQTAHLWNPKQAD